MVDRRDRILRRGDRRHLILNELDPADLTTRASVITGLSHFRAGLIVDLIALAVCVPFIAGLYFGSRRLAELLAERAIPREATALEAPTEALIELLQLTILVVVVMPMLAIVQPFLEPVEGIGALLVGIALLMVQVRRSSMRMRGQLQTAARLLASAIADLRRGKAQPHEIAGIGVVTPVRLPAGSAAVGRTLREIDLRSKTGATAVAITRGDEEVIVPTGIEPLQENDVIELAGPHDAIEAATQMLSVPRDATAAAASA